MREKILVIGACGQLGSELTPALWELFGKESVVIGDIQEPAGDLAGGNFEHLDVLLRDRLFRILNQHRFTQVYHLAAMLSYTGEQKPHDAWRLNMDGLINVLEGAISFGINKVYWPSSIAVFGPHTPSAATPQYTVMDPSTVYGISKQAGERWCEWYHLRYGVDVRSLRYPGLISYKTEPGGGTTDYAVHIFHKAIAENKYECFLRPDTQLPMMYMSDAVRATIELMEAPARCIGIRSSYNVHAMSFSPSQIAEEIKKYFPDFMMEYQVDVRQAIADSWPRSLDDAPAREQWGWRHRYGLSEMTADMIRNLSRKQQAVDVFRTTA